MNTGGFDISSLTGSATGASPGGSTPSPGPGGTAFVGQQAPGPLPMAVQANSLASSVNLSSIQSLVDLLLELPLPSETLAYQNNQQRLLTENQEQQHMTGILNQELGYQHLLSQQLSDPLLMSRNQLQHLNLTWTTSQQINQNQGNLLFNNLLQQNSYLLSLLQQKDAFGDRVALPLVQHPLPTQANLTPQAAPTQMASPSPHTPQTRSHSQQQQYWNPYVSDQQPAQLPLHQSIASPHRNQTNFPNQQMYTNDNSNSSSSFSESTSAAPPTPNTPLNSGIAAMSPYAHHQQQPLTPQQHHQQQQYYHQQKVQKRFIAEANGAGLVNVQHETPNFTAQLQNQESPKDDFKKDVKSHQNSAIKHSEVLLEKIDISRYNNSMNSYPSSTSSSPAESFSSLGDRVKSNKRQRMNSSGGHRSSTKGKHNHDKHEKECDKTSPKKVTKSPSKLSSSTPQLTSLSSSLPPQEKFEAMLDELFDLNKGKKSKLKTESDSESEDENHSKNSSKKTNGEVISNDDSKAALFDITLSSTTLSHFVALSAKLKRLNTMPNVPVSKLSNLLTVITQQLAIQSASLKDKRRKSIEGGDNEDSEDEEDSGITNSSTLMGKFEICCDCCLVALCIMTSKGMSSRVYLEECIEQIVAFLNTTIQQYTTIGASIATCTSPSKKGSPRKKFNNSYISPTSGTNKKILLKMYTKWGELIGYLVELLTLRGGSLTDTLVLSTTRVALGAFFLENLTTSAAISSSGNQSNNEIQLNALKLTTTIFSQYQGHRGVILEELLHSIARLPTNKRSRVIYKVEGDDGTSSAISMFSALFLQLIQSLFIPKEVKNEVTEELTRKECSKKGEEKESKNKEIAKSSKVIQLRKQYDAALRTAYSFLSTFLRKCCGLAVGSSTGLAPVSSDADFRVLFENLVNDLMVTLHKPNWPAAQLLTQVLIKLLVTNITQTVNTKGSGKGSGPGGGANAQLNLKLASLDHLGTICSRFAKELSDIDKVREDVKTSLKSLVNGDTKGILPIEDNEEDDKSPKKAGLKSKKAKLRRSSKEKDFNNEKELVNEIWKQLLRYCDEERLLEEKNLFTSIWLRELERELEIIQTHNTEEQNQNGAVPLNPQEQLDLKIKKFMNLYKTASNPNVSLGKDEEYHVIDSKTAELIIRYIDITQATTVKLFDSALGHVIATLSTTSNTVMRSRAMKSLSTILNNAPKHYATTLLSRSDLQRATKAALLDPSTSVREATIDLIGKFILNKQSNELIDKYYDIIAERILDAGVSVRKRVIKILREICLTYPTYAKVPEICSKIIKRINDDGEGIRKLVTETFTSMWFKEEKNREAIKMKVVCLNHVVTTVLTDRIGTEWLQQLLTNLFTANNNSKKTEKMDDDEDGVKNLSTHQIQQVATASSQIVDVLVSDILCGDHPEQPQQMNNKSTCVSAMTTIWLFAKSCPQLLVNHISTLQPFLATKCLTQLDIMILNKVVQIIELVLPKLSNPSETLLTRIEEDLTKNILQNNAQVLGVCVSCLSSLIHRHTNNKQLAEDLFRRFFKILDTLSKHRTMLVDPANRPRLLRALFTCGLFAKHFEFLQEKQQLYEIFVNFVVENMPSNDNGMKIGDLNVLEKALTGLGFMFERNPAFTLKHQTQNVYKTMLGASTKQITGQDNEIVTYHETTICQVLKNLTNYLSDEFNNEMSNQIEWSREDLKSMTSDEGDTSSVQSSIIQLYLSDILRCTLSSFLPIRRAAVNLCHIIHNGGHVHPLQLVPYLIAMSSDDDVNIRSRADHVLNEIERKYHGFVSMKSKQGVQLSYILHSHSGRRGYRVENVNLGHSNLPNKSSGSSSSSEHEQLITGRLSTLYSVVAGNRQSRRAFVGSLLKYFDMVAGISGFLSSTSYDSMISPSLLAHDDDDPGPIQQFVLDNIIWLPYSVWDEPLYLLNQLELTISLLASHTQSQFKDALCLQDDEEEDEDDVESKKKSEEQPAPILNMKNDNQTKTEDDNDPLQKKFVKTDEEIIVASADFIPPAKIEDNFCLRTFLPPIPSILSLVELHRSLKAFYMLSWSKQLFRDLFSITDAKLQDYSPNENQKVWDKQMHRKHIEVRLLEKLMKYPEPGFNPETPDDRTGLLSEYHRFKNLQLTGLDTSAKSVMQLLKEPASKSISHHGDPASRKRSTSQEQFERITIPEISKEEKDEIIKKMKARECSVNLIDISSMDISKLSMSNSTMSLSSSMISAQQQQKPIKITISTSSGTINTSNSSTITPKRKKKKKEKKKKKHKKHKFRVTSDDEDGDSQNDNSDVSDSDEDPDYC